MDEIKEAENIVCNSEAFDEEYAPEKPRCRDSQIKELWSSLVSTPRGRRTHVFLFSPSGTGKTLIAKCLKKELEERSVIVAHINCWEHQSFHSIMDKINGDFRIIQAERNSTVYKIERLEKFLNLKPLPLDKIPIFRQTSATRVPDSACRRAKAICSSVNFDFFIRDVLLPRILPQNCHFEWNSFQG